MNLPDTNPHSAQEFGINTGSRKEYILKALASNGGDVLIGGSGRNSFPLSPGEGVELKARQIRRLTMTATALPAAIAILT